MSSDFAKPEAGGPVLDPSDLTWRLALSRWSVIAGGIEKKNGCNLETSAEKTVEKSIIFLFLIK